MKLAVIGTGYVGIITAAGFAEKGHKVTCVDILPEKIESIKKKKSPLYEAGLDKVLKKLVGKKLFATTNLAEAVKDADVSFICVGTPSAPDGSIDLKYIKSASAAIGQALSSKKKFHTVIVKSTVIPGTTDSIILPILEKASGKKAGRDFGLGMNPEFLKEGTALADVRKPDRIILGAGDQKTLKVLKALYSKFKAPKLAVDTRTAETIKYANNAFLATKISFINEMANICEKFNVDIYEIAKGIGLDERISPRFLAAGAGFGGSCFPKDVKALAAASRAASYEPTLLNAVLEVNASQPLRMVELARSLLGELRGKTIAVLGLAFKPETDDIREAPSLIIIESLLRASANVRAYDPKATANVKTVFGNMVQYCKKPEDTLKGSDCALIVTEWKQVKALKLNSFKKLMASPIIVDGRRAFDPIKAKKAGLIYRGIGWRNK